MNIISYKKLKLIIPPINFFTNLLLEKKYFRFCKLNHAFWEMCLGQEPWKSIFYALHPPDFIDECISLAGNIPEDIMLGVSPCGPPHFNHRKKTVDEIRFAKNPDLISFKIKETIGERNIFYGPIWKYYTQQGVIRQFYKKLEKNKVIVVGLSHLSTIVFNNFIHYKININASLNKEETLVGIKNFRNQFKSPTTILFQTGEMFSMWLINKLQDMPETNLIDTGRALDIWCKTTEFSSEDKKIYREMIKDRPEVKQREIDQIFTDQTNQTWQKNARILF